MLNSLMRWFQSPIFPEDEDKTRRALLLNVVLNAIIVALPLLFTGTVFGGDRHGITLGIIVLIWVATLWLRYVLFTGQIAGVGIALVTIIHIAITLSLYNIGTIRSPAISFYFLTIMLSGLTINRSAIYWAAGISAMTVIALLLAEINGYLPPPTITVTITQGIVFTLVFTVVNILLSLAVKQIDDALAQARREIIERTHTKEREINRQKMMEKVIQIGKMVTEQTFDLRTSLFRIWDGVRNDLDFDRTAIFLYNPNDNSMHGTYGTDRLGTMSEEWSLKYSLDDNAFFKTILSQPDGFYFTKDYETERGLLTRPGHVMRGVKYYAATSVWAGNKPVALIIVDQLISGRVITDEQLEALRFSAGYAGLAIENARLSEREQSRRKMMKRVIEIGKAVTEQTADLRITLLKIRNSVRDSLDFDRAAVFLYDINNNLMQGSYGTDRLGQLSEEWDLRFEAHDSTNFLQRVISQPDGFFHTDDYERDLETNMPSDHPMKGVKQFSAVACWNGGKPVAVICADQLISGRVITGEQIEALRFFAGYAGLAIENARLSEREQTRQQVMKRVMQISKKVTEQTTDLRTTLLRIWDSVHNDLDFDRAGIFLHDPSDNSVQGSYGTNRSGDMIEEWDMRFKPLENGFLQKVLSQPNGFYSTQDYEGELNIASDHQHPMRGVKHYAAAACWSGDKPIAVICVDQLLSGRVITIEQSEALRLFAGYAGLAIENARLNTELEGHIQERETFIAELGNRNAELERFTYTVSHDLRSPLVTIKGFVGMLNKDIEQGEREKVSRDMQRIANAADKMDSLLSDLLELSRVGRIANPPEEIDLVKLAYDTLETVDGRLRAKSITAHVSPNLPVIHADRTRIGEVLANLIDNAAKYMGDQPIPLIEIGSRTDDDEQVIYVKDNGMGIESRYLQRVFSLFEKLNPTSEGTGIGLALIKRIIEVHGGKIWVESEGLGKGSTFCFTLPGGKTESK